MGDDDTKKGKARSGMDRDFAGSHRIERPCEKRDKLAVQVDKYACGCVGISLVIAKPQGEKLYELVDFAMMGICTVETKSHLTMSRDSSGGLFCGKGLAEALRTALCGGETGAKS